MANKNSRGLSSRKGLEDNLFENIADLSKKNASEQEFHQLAKRFFLDDSVVLGTSTFYDFLKPENRTKKIHLCNGTACMVANSQNKLHHKLEKYIDKDEIGHVACVGRCHSNHAVLFKNKTFSIQNDKDLKDLFDSDEKNYTQKNTYNIGCNTTPILTSPINDLKNFYTLAEDPILNPAKIIEELKIANLRGRGGAGIR